MAMMANDMGLVSSGITTFFYSLTDGFEPGMRSRETVRQILDFLDQQRAQMRAGVKIHIRHEQANTEDHDELVGWIKSGRIDLLSLNNHLPPEGNEKAFNRYLAGFKRRVPGDADAASDMIKGFQHRLPTGLEQFQELAALTSEYGVSLASHDDKSDADVDLSLSRGVNIAEFPMTLEMSHRFRENNVHVLMGAPNAVRGGSHVAAVSARDAIVAGAVDVLCSDYHYPSLFRAPFLLSELGFVEFPRAWDLVSANAAAATGLQGRKGRIEPGMDADLLLVSGLTGFSSDLKAVIRGGRFVLSSELSF
jgi:alpha-D-ribose 1-methylphosphonate 5-triphosphate diphosphatase